MEVVEQDRQSGVQLLRLQFAVNAADYRDFAFDRLRTGLLEGPGAVKPLTCRGILAHGSAHHTMEKAAPLEGDRGVNFGGVS